MKEIDRVEIEKPTNLIAFSGGYVERGVATQAVYVLKRDGVPIGRLLTSAGEPRVEHEFLGVIVGPGVLTLEAELISGPDRLEGEITIGGPA